MEVVKVVDIPVVGDVKTLVVMVVNILALEHVKAVVGKIY